jgi:hypothetical protein
MTLYNLPMELQQLLSVPITTALALAVYVAVCRGLRFRRRDQEHAKYPYRNREDFSKMTTEHAWEITNYMSTLEFPFMTEKALQFALFRYAC